jgi:hypothetical protein
MVDAIEDGDRIFSKYEDFKCSFKDTQALCQAQGSLSTP